MAGFFLNDFAEKESVVELPKTKEDLQRIGYLITGLRVPDKPVCLDHVSPMQAISDAFFCKTPISVWHASRGFGGKSILLAYLSMLEAVISGASVSLLGGSGEQSERVHGYITGTDTNLPDTFWSCPTMPLDVKRLLLTDPTKKETNLSNGGKIRVLMASQTSVRGPHPQKLRLDECLFFDSLIDTPNGLKRIDSLKVGDYVYSYFDDFNPTHACLVTNVINKGVRETIIVVTKNGKKIQCTRDHKILTDTGWKYAVDISLNDKICTCTNGKISYSWISKVSLGNDGEVWDITVKDSHTFIANGMVVHNCDEMPLKILDASLGQPMSARGIPIQIVMSSTHHNPNGTMTEILKRAKDRSWPIYRWCYKENLLSNGGWLDDRDVEVRRTTYTDFSWKAEIELQEPSPESRAIMTEKVEKMFNVKLGRFVGSPEEYIEIETPQENARYATGADWAQKRDWTVIATFRTDCEPAKLVAFRRTGRKPWSEMIGYFDDQVKRFKGNAAHDNTGVGNVVRDIMKVKSRPIELSQKMKFQIVTAYIKAIEDGKLECPVIEYVYQEHKYATRNDIIGTGHLPDTICAMAIAWHTRNRNSWARGSNG